MPPRLSSLRQRTARILALRDPSFYAKPPDNEFDVRQSAASRAAIEKYLKKTKTTLWIEHDFGANAKLKKAPPYYE